MHLKEVHMENFKSFGRKLSVPFDSGYTAITGPNGSGKSNIGDAIMFVLGPNSPRAIRAGRLTDLIFNGGQDGKASSYCLVSLTFDNQDRVMPVDADEVVLTRKVKKHPKKDDPDGYNSYFYVNDRASKKREFVDILQHARISADGYNITAQGDVLQICQMSNVERRKVLDNIAGVTAFDTDIAQADKRRSEVEENLERISIVLEEIGRSLKQLEKEKEAAEKLRDLKAAVARLKGLMAYRRKGDLEDRIAHVQQEITRFTEERAKHEASLTGLKEQYKETQRQFSELEAQIRAEGGEEVEKLQDEIKAARDHLVRYEEKINFAKTELQDRREDVEPLQAELRRIQKELEKTQKIHADETAVAAETAVTLGTAKKERDDLQDLISRSTSGAMELNRELSKLKQEHEDRLTEMHQARLDADRITERRDTLQAQLATGEEELSAVKQDREEAAWALEELLKTTQGAGKQRKELERRRFDLRKAQAEFAQQQEDLENRIRRLQREYAELQAQQEAAARATGAVGRAVEMIMQARDQGQIRGIIGTISELASVDDKYSTALETAAGANMNAVIVEDDAAAAACIEMLKQSKAGRAKLLPLNKMVPGRPRGQALMKVKQDGCLGFALDLIDFNPRFQNAFWHAFGDTLVARNMDAGRRLMGGVRIVTMDGELFEAGGAMIGGSQKRGGGPGFSNADRGRLDEVLGSIQEAEMAQETAIEGLSRVRRELEELESQLGTMGDASSEDRAKELEKRHTRLLEKEQSLQTQLEKLREQSGEASEAVIGLEERLKALGDRLAEMEKIREEKGKLLLKGGRKDLRERAEALEIDIRELTEKTLKAENRRDVAATQLALVNDRVKEVQKAIDDVVHGRARHEEDLKRYSEAMKKAQAEVDALMAMERKATKSLRGLQEKKDKAYQQLVDLKAKMDKIADRMETHYGLIANAKSKLPNLEEQLGEAMVELAENPVEIAPDEDVAPYDELKKEMRNKEAAIDRLGAVNMRALDEFEAQSGRQRDLQGETDRLHSQRNELVTLVDEIKKKKKTALMEVFTHVNENFAGVYARLSLGGKAYMKLENEEDPFEGGLILMAQPMGKRVTRLDALSGGEKSLTSMAFIFAIQQYEPSPFYYLDEVDQNLDAVNSELLAKLVREQSKFAQFIQVSLRKITLKEASFIYGVTQTTPGMSEIIANFDLDQLRDVPEGTTGDEPDDDDKGGGSDRGDDKGKGLTDTLREMVTVEVKQ